MISRTSSTFDCASRRSNSGWAVQTANIALQSVRIKSSMRAGSAILMTACCSLSTCSMPAGQLQRMQSAGFLRLRPSAPLVLGLDATICQPLRPLEHTYQVLDARLESASEKWSSFGSVLDVCSLSTFQIVRGHSRQVNRDILVNDPVER